MAQRETTQKMFEEGTEIGIKNNILMPEIRNWCAHIILTDVSAGMIAQISGLPTTVNVTCPHANSGSSGMMLDWIAGSFILENCQGCKFHQSITENNFGTRIIAENQQRETKETQKKQQEAETHHKLKESIDALVNVEKTKAQITQLSIFQLLDSLQNSANKEINAKLVLEASKIDPGFFSPLSLDVLSLYFEDDKIGSDCLTSANEILQFTKFYPETIFNRALQALHRAKHFNDVALLFPYYINSENIRANEESILTLITSLKYERSVGDPYDLTYDYTNSIGTINYLIGEDRGFMLDLFKKQLQINDKITRININNCLQEITALTPSFALEMLPELMNSFELDDDQYMDSADDATCATVGMLVKYSPQSAYDIVNEKRKILGIEALIGSLKLYKYLLSDSEFTGSHSDFSQNLISELIQLTMSKSETERLHEHYIDELYYLRDDQANLLEPHFNTLLGYLSQIVEDEKTFLWWREEIKTKKPVEVTTYNPLLNKNNWDIEAMRLRYAKDIRHVKDIIRKIFEINSAKHLTSIQQLIKNLDSKSHPRYKSELINIISTTLDDPFLISGLIPDLYLYLFDMDAVVIRVEGMKFLDRIIDKYPQLLTKTLLDLTDVFLKDPEVVIRAKAIEIQSSIAERIPDQFNTDNVDLIIGCMLDRYVLIHKTAAKKCTDFIQFMDDKKRYLTLMNLMNLEDHYKTDDEEFAKTVVKQILHLVKDIPKVFRNMTREYVLVYCRSSDYYTAKEFIDLLCEIKIKFPEFEDDWLKIIIDVFNKTLPSFRTDMDWRAELYNEIYSLSYSCIQRNITLLEKFLNDRKESDGYDIIQMLNVLAYFEFHEKSVDFVIAMKKRLQRVNSNEGLFRLAEIQMNFSAFEIGLINGDFHEDYLKEITDALQKRES